MSPDVDLLDRITTAASGSDPDDRIRELLRLLREVSGLDSAYLTRVDRNDDTQYFTHSDNSTEPGALHIPESLTLSWADTLCHRAVAEDVTWNEDVPETWGDNAAGAEFGIQTYVSVPVRLWEKTLNGTLCLASTQRLPQDAAVMGLLHLVAIIIADTLAGQELLAEERARRARAERFLRERTTFTAQVEHAMRTPLTLIHGWAEMLEARGQDMTSEEREQAITTIVKHSHRLLAQIEGLMDEARASMAVSAFRPQPVRLDLVARELGPVVAPRRFVVEGDAVVVTDPAAARVLLEHLVENVAAHTPDDTTVTVRVTAQPDPVHGDGVTLVVEDDGPGLPDGVDLFEAFAQGDDSTGTGLGLHIVQTITHALDGHVVADHRPGGGARFTIHLPDRTTD